MQSDSNIPHSRTARISSLNECVSGVHCAYHSFFFTHTSPSSHCTTLNSVACDMHGCHNATAGSSSHSTLSVLRSAQHSCCLSPVRVQRCCVFGTAFFPEADAIYFGEKHRARNTDPSERYDSQLSIPPMFASLDSKDIFNTFKLQ